MRRLLCERAGGAQAIDEVAQVGGAMLLRRGEGGVVAGEPFVGDEVYDGGEAIFGEQWGEAGVGLGDGGGVGQQNVILDHGEWGAAARFVVVPGVVEVERGAVVDEPEPRMPDEEVGVA